MSSSTNILMPWPNWKVVKKLGQGGFGSVYEIERNLAGMKEKAALKIISRPTEDELERELQQWLHGAELFQKNIQIFWKNASVSTKC